MATKVEVERLKIKQLSRIETKLMSLEDKVETLTQAIEDMKSLVAGEPSKTKKVKSEK